MKRVLNISLPPKNEIAIANVVDKIEEETGFGNTPWIHNGVKWFPQDVDQLVSNGHIDYGCKRFAFRELTFGDMKKLARLSETDNESKVIFDVLNDMTDGIDVSALDPCDARFLLFYIRALSLTDPNFYLRYTCSCKAVNPFAFNPSEFGINRLNVASNTHTFEHNGVTIELGRCSIYRDIEVEELITEMTETDKSIGNIGATIADVKMASYITKVDGQFVSVADAYERLNSLPYTAVRQVGDFLTKIPSYGFEEVVTRHCHACKAPTKVAIPLSKLFFFNN